MLSQQEAKDIAQKAFPTGKIDAIIDYHNVYVVRIFVPKSLETEWDPFYSVDKDSGDVRDFSIITDGNTPEILDLFKKAKEVT